jgi:hypothetical protein
MIYARHDRGIPTCLATSPMLEYEPEGMVRFLHVLWAKKSSHHAREFETIIGLETWRQ